MSKKPNAFTMIELLVSATVIILLTAIALVSFSQSMISSRNAKRKADLETIRQALTLYKQDKGYYAASTSVDFSALVISLYADEYLSEPSLLDPKNATPYVYQATCTATSGSNCTKVTLRANLEPDSTAYEIIAL
jgi:type II secretory pathway pseudopilin PulG